MSGGFDEQISGSSDDKLRTPGKTTLTAAAAPATPDPGKQTHTARALPRTTRDVGVLGPASTSAHHAAPLEVSETDDAHGLNAIIKVVAYGPGGKVLARWAARAHWEVALAEPVAGRLPPNHQYAGGEFPRDLLPPKYRKQGLRFGSTGRAEFEPFAMKLPNGQSRSESSTQDRTKPTRSRRERRQAFRASSLAAGPGTTSRGISARCSSCRRTFTRPCDTLAAQPTTST